MRKNNAVTPIPPQHHVAGIQTEPRESSIKSALMLSGIALFSLVLVAGVTVWKQTRNADAPTQFAAASVQQPAPAQTSVADTVRIPTAQSDTIETEQQAVAALIRPAPEQQTASGAAPQLPPQVTRTPAPQVAQTSESADTRSPLLALIDEHTGTARELDVNDLQSLSYSDKDMVTPETIEQDERVTRLDSTPLGAKRVQTPTAEASRTPQTYTCVDAVRAIAADSTVFFYTSGAELTPRAIAKIRNLGAAIERCPQVVVQVNGHSDASGDENLNMAISWQRADNTIAALASLGFDTSRLDPVGFGSSLPLAQGDSNSDIDRRVEFEVMEKR